ncbi:MAG TPA: hypothetical protein VFU47_04825 [Armatimonadota bacterium]|nr:hypothetical protein [Armatimonadota bacterium]
MQPGAIDLLVALAVGGCLTGLGVWIKSFLSGHAERTGQNVATLRDIDRVERRLEALQAEFSATVSKAVAAYGHRFEAEMRIYRELWDQVLQLHDAADAIWYEGLSRAASAEAYSLFRDRLEHLHREIRSVRPFFPQEMAAALLVAQLPVRKFAAEISNLNYSSAEEVRTLVSARLPELWKALGGLEDAIRTRLWSEDARLDRMISGSDQASTDGAAMMAQRTEIRRAASESTGA